MISAGFRGRLRPVFVYSRFDVRADRSYLFVMLKQALIRGWNDTNDFMGALQLVVAVAAIPFVGFALHYLIAGIAPVTGQVSGWLIYTLASTTIVFGGILLWNIAAAPYRIERDARQAAEARLGTLTPAQMPDMSMRELFYHINREGVLNDVLWAKTEALIYDQLALGHLTAYGREMEVDDDSWKNRQTDDEDMGHVFRLLPIPSEAWRYMKFDATYLMDGAPLSAKQTIFNQDETAYCDLRVFRSEALNIWPEPGVVLEAA